MSVPVILVLAVVALVSLVAVAAVVAQLVARIQRLSEDVVRLEQDLTPVLDRLKQDADVTGRELERVSASLDEVSRRRAER